MVLNWYFAPKYQYTIQNSLRQATPIFTKCVLT